MRRPPADPPTRRPPGDFTAEPPHDIAAEQCVLGGMLMSKDAISDVLEVIRPGDHYRPAHQLVHEVILGLYSRGEPVDPVTVANDLTKRGEIARVGGAPYLHTLIAAVPTAANAGYYARIVRERASLRRLIEVGSRIVQLGYSGDGEAEDIIVRATTELAAVADAELSGNSRSILNPTRRIILTSAADIAPLPTRWGWTTPTGEGRLPAGHVGLIPGREGIGKSLLLIWLTARITRGELPGVYEGSPRAVFYCASEDSWQHTISPRLIAAGADRDLVYRVEVEELETSMRIGLTLPRDCDLLASEIKRTGAAMIALDPMMSVIDHSIDTYNDRDMRTALEPLGKLADDTGCMVVALAHFNKNAGDDPLNLVTGSRAFTAFVRSVIAVARDPEADDGGCVISQVNNNLGRSDLPNLTYVVKTVAVETAEGDAEVGRLHFTGESARGVRDILAEAANGIERTERAECAEWLREALANGPRRTKEIEAEGRERGFSQRTQWRARKQLGVRADQVASGPKGRNEWWLSLAQEADDHAVD